MSSEDKASAHLSKPGGESQQSDQETGETTDRTSGTRKSKVSNKTTSVLHSSDAMDTQVVSSDEDDEKSNEHRDRNNRSNSQMPHRGSPQQPWIFIDGDGRSFSTEEIIAKFGPASNTGTKGTEFTYLFYFYLCDFIIFTVIFFYLSWRYGKGYFFT